MNRLLAVLCFVVGIAMMILGFPEGFAALATVVICSAVVITIIRQQVREEADFLVQLFLIALLVRLVFGIFIHIFDLREFFGADSQFYDSLGARLTEIWYGDTNTNDSLAQRAMRMSGPGWGMNYLVGLIYLLLGRNIFAAQSFCAVIGAATAPMIYRCAYEIFGNRQASKTSAFLVALYPALIIWSGQLIKDGLIIFLLVLAVTMVLQLQRKFSYINAALLVFSLFGILSLRFYIFYMVTIAVVGSFVIGFSNSPSAILKRVIVLIIIGLSLTYLGVIQNAGDDIEQYGNLEMLQRSRNYLSESESGFGSDLDVSTTVGAITALPVGFTYLIFAPFPWQINNFRQAITLPEVLLWWASIPLLISGLWYTIKYRLRASIAVLIFTLMLTVVYSVFQGNVGTAYRQRTQIQVFLFMFIAVGWTLVEERRENKKLLMLQKRQQINKRLRKDD